MSEVEPLRSVDATVWEDAGLMVGDPAVDLDAEPLDCVVLLRPFEGVALSEPFEGFEPRPIEGVDALLESRTEVEDD